MLGGLIRSQDRPSRQVSKRDKMGTAAGGWWGVGTCLQKVTGQKLKGNVLFIIRNCYEQLIVLLK